MKTVKGPYVKSPNKTSKIMRNLLISLLPIVLFSFYKNGIVPYQKGYVNILEMFYPILFVLVGTLSSLLIEEIYIFVIEKKRGQELIDAVLNGYSIFPGLFLALVLPINTPLSILFIGCLVSIVVGKMLFGGFGNNIFNPALVGCIFIMACFGTAISTNGGYLNKYEVDTISSATPLTNVSLVEGIGNYDTLVKPYGSLTNFFIGTIPGAIGETSALLCIVAFIFLTFTKTIKWRIPVTYIGTVFIMTFIIGSVNGLGIWYPLFQILSGGLFFGAVFMATDPVTSPVNKESQYIYGIMLGLMTTILRYMTAYPEGVMTSILFMNMLVYILDKYTAHNRFNYKLIYIALGVMTAITIGTGLLISTKYIKNPEEAKEVDASYNIISKQKEDNKTVYEVTQKGFGGKIKAEIIFSKNKIVSIQILENSESPDRLKLITDQNYLDTLVEKQENISGVDTVSGATISSTALRKMVSNTLDDYKNNPDEIENTEIVEKYSTIVSSTTDGEMTTNIVDVNSFGGVMELEIVMKGSVIKTVAPITFNDSCVTEAKKNPYYNCPSYMDQGYINELIKNQDTLDNVDTVSGATISSTALKNTIKEMKEGSN